MTVRVVGLYGLTGACSPDFGYRPHLLAVEQDVVDFVKDADELLLDQSSFDLSTQIMYSKTSLRRAVWSLLSRESTNSWTHRRSCGQVPRKRRTLNHPNSRTSRRRKNQKTVKTKRKTRRLKKFLRKEKKILRPNQSRK